jgi:hypothetical protein
MAAPTSARGAADCVFAFADAVVLLIVFGWIYGLLDCWIIGLLDYWANASGRFPNHPFIH